MLGSLGNPQTLGLGLFSIELVHHVGGYEVVAVAMDEEHGMGAVLDLVEGRSFAEGPPIFEFAEQGGGVEQRELRKPELLAQLVAELIPCTGISAVFDETDAFQP